MIFPELKKFTKFALKIKLAPQIVVVEPKNDVVICKVSEIDFDEKFQVA